MTRLPRMRPILPWWQLAGLLGLCAAGIYSLLPDDPKLLDNLLRDGNTREARRLLERVPPESRAREADRFRLIELRLARQELPPADPANPAQLAARHAAVDTLWSQAVVAWAGSHFADSIFLELQSLVPQLPDPAAAWPLVAPHFNHAPAKQRALLVDLFVRGALAHSQAATAAEVFALAHPAPSRTSEQSLGLARLWQLAGRPADALSALGDDPAPSLAERRLALLRELNRNREALALLRARDTDLTRAPDAALTTQIVDTALAAGAPAEAVPVLRRFVDAHPTDLAALRRLRQLIVASGDPSSSIDPARRAAELSHRHVDDLVELARILEYSGRAHDAFTVWHELALKDHPGALDRLLALNPGLFRDADLARALAHALQTQPRDEHLLALARLQVDLGHYGPARTTFERYLARRAEPAVMLELARVHRENFEFDSAVAWLRRAAASRTDDLDLRRQIADLLILQGRHSEALAAYGELVERSDAEEIIGPFTRIAEALGRFDEFARGLQRRVAVSEAPTERDFILLAYAHELAANPAARRAAIEEGLRRHPASDDLRLQFAYILAAARQHKAAERTLAAHTRLREDVNAATLYLDLLRLDNDTAAERRFLSIPFAPALAGDETVLERIARAREASRDYPEAARIWRLLLARHPDDFVRAGDLARLMLVQKNPAEARRLLAPFLREPTAPVLKLAAEIAEAAADHRAAERYQIAYLEAVQDAPATDWGALGDIRLARGDRTGARSAYAEALRRLHAEIAHKAAVR